MITLEELIKKPIIKNKSNRWKPAINGITYIPKKILFSKNGPLLMLLGVVCTAIFYMGKLNDKNADAVYQEAEVFYEQKKYIDADKKMDDAVPTLRNYLIFDDPKGTKLRNKIKQAIVESEQKIPYNIELWYYNHSITSQHNPSTREITKMTAEIFARPWQNQGKPPSLHYQFITQDAPGKDEEKIRRLIENLRSINKFKMVPQPNDEQILKPTKAEYFPPRFFGEERTVITIQAENIDALIKSITLIKN